LDDPLARGYDGLRLTSGVTCFFKDALIGELAAYERTPHRVLDTPMIAVCAKCQVAKPSTDALEIPPLGANAEGKQILRQIQYERGAASVLSVLAK
jgi:hypothetical protein